ncbi:MAG: DUF4870 domain-containing protein [Myxococcales bacterium]|nr:DUF4870 domain-containing protein [Myxococcales bacterium]
MKPPKPPPRIPTEIEDEREDLIESSRSETASQRVSEMKTEAKEKVAAAQEAIASKTSEKAQKLEARANEAVDEARTKKAELSSETAIPVGKISDRIEQTDARADTESKSDTQKDETPTRKLTATESNWAMGVHLAAVFGYISFVGFAVGPLVVWFLRRNEDAFVDEQGKEAINFQLSMILYYIGAAILSLVLVGIPILIALFIFQLVEIILASVRAKEGRSYRYPLTIRFIS